MPAVVNENTQYVDTGGKPLVNGFIYFGLQNADPVLNPISIFSDRALTVAITNPQVLDDQGRSTNKVWLTGRYSLRIEDLNNVQQLQELDNGDVADTGAIILENVSGANTITATAASTISQYDDKAIYTFTAAQINTAVVTLNIDGVGAKSVFKNHNQELNPGDFEEDQVVLVSYNLTDDVFEVINQNVKTIQFNEASAVAAATTTDIWAAGGNTLHVTGTTGPITSFGTAPNVGARRKLIFDDVVTLTNSTDINLPGGIDYTTAAGDILDIYADTVTQFDIQISKIDGLAVTVAPIFLGRTLLETLTPSAASTATFTAAAIFDDTYDTIEIVAYEVDISADNIFMQMVVSTDGGSTFETATNQYHFSIAASAGSGYSGSAATSSSSIQVGANVGGAAGESWSCNLRVNNLNGTTLWKIFSGIVGWVDQNQDPSGGQFVAAWTGGTDAIDAIRFQPASGTFTGVFRAYGITKV